jgi:hypothetical protein
MDNVVSKCLTREKTVTGDRISFTRHYMDQIKYLLKLANPWHRLTYCFPPLTLILGVGKELGWLISTFMPRIGNKSQLLLSKKKREGQINLCCLMKKTAHKTPFMKNREWVTPDWEAS